MSSLPWRQSRCICKECPSVWDPDSIGPTSRGKLDEKQAAPRYRWVVKDCKYLSRTRLHLQLLLFYLNNYNFLWGVSSFIYQKLDQINQLIYWSIIVGLVLALLLRVPNSIELADPLLLPYEFRDNWLLTLDSLTFFAFDFWPASGDLIRLPLLR